MTALGFDTYEKLKAYILFRAEEETDSTSDFDSAAEDAIIQAWRDLTTRWPWVDLEKDPIGSGVVAADITSFTITIASTGTSVTGTLSAASADSLTGYKIRPSGKNWHARIASHSGGSASVTLDAVPETVAAGTEVTIFKDEYELASDLGAFIDGIWWQDGTFVKLVDAEWLRRHYPDPPLSALVPHAFARIGRRQIRFSEYPQDIQRFEYPYTYEPSDPSGTDTLGIPAHLRHALAQLSLSLLYEMKLDRREAAAKGRAEELIERAITYERRRRTGFGQFQVRGATRYGN